MGDAVRGGDVHSSDDDRTIDGAEPRPDAPTRSTESTRARDYAELREIERHHYVIDGEIAKGGMGRVLDARDLRLGRNVAIKELLPKNRDAAKRFEREARITARLQHPAIIHVYEAGVWPGGEPFYAMQRVAGRSLDKVVAERETLAERLALVPNVIAVADALAYAHSQNVIHRDLKPANVLVGNFGETVVIDWGLAKDLGAVTDPRESLAMRIRQLPEETVSGSIVGTPAYMPPEQARGDAIDQRVDVYAIGALLYNVLAGHAPYSGKHGKEVLEQVKAGPPARIVDRAPGAPRDLVAIVEKAMARSPDDRYITAGELAQDLKRFQTGQLVAAHRYTRSQLFRRFVRRHRVAVSVAAVSLLALVFVGTLSVTQIIAKTRVAQNRRNALLEERGRSEVLADHPGIALPYLLEAARAGGRHEALDLLIADAIRSFEAQVSALHAGNATIRIAASPDGRHVATAGSSGVKLWTVDGVLERDLGDAGGVRVIAFDRQSARLAAGGDDGVLHLWTSDGVPIARVRAHRSAVEDLTFSPDGTRVATGADDHAVRIWDATTGVLASDTVECHEHAVTSVRFSPNGNRLASADSDGMLCIFQGYVGRRQLRRQAHKKGTNTNSVRWSTDGLLLVLASDDGTASVWSALRGKPVVAPMHAERDVAVYAAEVTRDRRVVTASDDRLARVWKLPEIDPAELTDDDNTVDRPGSGKLPEATPLWTLRGHADKVVTAGWSDDETRLVTGGYDRRVIVWDPATGQRIASFEQSDVVADFAFIVGNKRLVTSSRDGTARIWDIERASAQRGGKETDSEVHAVAISGDVVAVGTDDSKVTLWPGTGDPDADGPRAVVLPGGHEASVYALAFTPSGDRLISGGGDPELRVWDVHRHVCVGKLAGLAEDVTSIAVAPDGDTVAAASGGRAFLWSIRTGNQRALDSAGARTDHVAFSPDGLLAGGGGRAVVLWNPSRGGAAIATVQQSWPVTAIAFSRDGRSLAVAGQGDAHIYAVAGNTLGAALPIEGPTGDVRAVAFSPAGGILITASDDGIVKLWDAHKGKLLGVRDAHAGRIAALALTDDGSQLWVGGKLPESPGRDEQGWLVQWDVHHEDRSLADLRRFVDERVPWVLTEGDVVERREMGGLHGQR